MVKHQSFLKRTILLTFLFFILSFFIAEPASAQNSAIIKATVSISICGNNEIETGQVCDTKNLDNKTCLDFGYKYGELRCGLACDEFDLSDCSYTKSQDREKDILEEEKEIENEGDEEKSNETEEERIFSFSNEYELERNTNETNGEQNESKEENLFLSSDSVLSARSPP